MWRSLCDYGDNTVHVNRFWREYCSNGGAVAYTLTRRNKVEALSLARPHREQIIMAAEEDKTDEAVPEQEQEELLQEYLEALGIQLSLQRKFMKMNQKSAAAKAGLHRRTVSDLENGNNGNLKTMVQYCQALNISFALLAARAEREIEARKEGIILK
jgi:DNA-binding XRE family transcriptional regulator